MLPLIYTNSTAASVFLAACLVWLVPEMVGMFPQMAKVSRKTVVVQDRGSMLILIGLQWAGLAGYLSLLRTGYKPVRFNGKLRDELLNGEIFNTLQNAKN